MIDDVGQFYSQFLSLIKIVSSIPERDQLYFMQISVKTVTAVGILSYIYGVDYSRNPRMTKIEPEYI